MAGVGRRTLYRKSVTDEYLNSTPEPGENEEIALVQAPRGSNIIEIVLATGEQALAVLPTRFRKLIWVKRGDYLITSAAAGDFETSAGESGKVRHRVESILNKDQIKHLKKQELWPDGADAFGGVLPAAGPGSGTPREGWGDAIGTGGDGDAAASTATENANKETEESTKAFGSTKKGDAGGVEEDLVTGVSRCCVSDAAGDNEEGEEEEEEEEEEDDMSDLFVNNNRAAMMQLRRDHEDDESESESESASDDDEAGR